MHSAVFGGGGGGVQRAQLVCLHTNNYYPKSPTPLTELSLRHGEASHQTTIQTLEPS